MACRVSREDFEMLVEEALERLPEKYKKYFANIAITVEDYPGEEDRGRLAPKKELLLGLFSGVPYPKKRGFFEIPYPLPDKIILFQKNIETICSTEEELIEQIQATLVHEVGHYFGLSEEDLRKYER
ncbi:MAG: metallopeptidase family protein [Nitrospirae bacterium]|nr:metallopeptidase family protein [Nitrospirota bacterium]MCL5422972.1 metallopeptidase family protein [Nitrospirota bacterium]